MFPRVCVVALVSAMMLPAITGAAVIFGAPTGGPATIHDGNLGIDLNGDGVTDLTIIDQPAYGPGTNNIAGSWSHVLQSLGVGVYRGANGAIAVAMEPGQQVGPAIGGNFVYSDQGLTSDAIIHMYDTPVSDIGDPAWTDGFHHFVGVDVPSGADHHYGWVELSLQSAATPTSAEPWFDVTVYDWAYDTQANQPLPVPEPSPLGLESVLSATAAIGGRRRGQSRANSIGINHRIRNNYLATGTAVRINWPHPATGRA